MSDSPISPLVGRRAYIVDIGRVVQHDGTEWVYLNLKEGETVSGVVTFGTWDVLRRTWGDNQHTTDILDALATDE